MSRQTRRGFVSGAAAATLLVTGCVGNGSGAGDGTDTPTDGTNTSTEGEKNDVPALTGYEVSDAVVRPSAERPDDHDSWGLFVATREAAEARFGDPKEGSDDDVEAVREFVEETDFDAGDHLLYVESYGPQTCYELVLDGEPKIAENGLPRVDARVDRTEPEDQPCGDAVTPVHLLVRLSFDLDAGPADVVEVRVADGWDEVDELRLDAER